MDECCIENTCEGYEVLLLTLRVGLVCLLSGGCFFATPMMCNFCGLHVTVFKRLVHVKILCGPPVLWMQLECLEVGENRKVFE